MARARINRELNRLDTTTENSTIFELLCGVDGKNKEWTLSILMKKFRKPSLIIHPEKVQQAGIRDLTKAVE